MLSSFLIGAIGYPLLELAYRRRTHYSMALAGGLSMLLIRRLSRVKAAWIIRMLICGLGITCIELLCAAIWNRRYTVWDYRNQPWNLRGQICLHYSVLWCALSGIMLGLISFISKLKRPG